MRHMLLAADGVAVWGTNCTAITVAPGADPALFFATLPFSFAFLPALLLLPRRSWPGGTLAAWAVLIGVGQFGLLYIAMRNNISPGLASLVLQTQVFSTIGLSMALAGERVRLYQGVALALGVAGIA